MTEPNTPAPPPLGDSARLLAEAAQLEAKSLGHSFVGMEHILLALLADPELAAAAASRGAPDREELRRRLASAGPPRSVVSGGDFGLSPQARRLLEGTGSINRSELLERIVGNPRGPLAKLLGRESRVAIPRSRRRKAGGSRRRSKRGAGSRSGNGRRGRNGRPNGRRSEPHAIVIVPPIASVLRRVSLLAPRWSARGRPHRSCSQRPPGRSRVARSTSGSGTSSCSSFPRASCST